MRRTSDFCETLRFSERLPRMRRRAFLALFFGTALAVLISLFAPMLAGYDAVRSDTLRLHILANSDSSADQAVKLEVRDAILQAQGQVLGGASTKEEALRSARAALPEIERIANETLAANGCTYRATARLENLYFATKDYRDFTLPAGRYDAVRVELGEHEGHNWFCVLFPPLCVPAAVDADDAPAYSDEEEADVTSPYKIEFAAVEAVERVREWLFPPQTEETGDDSGAAATQEEAAPK